MRCVAVSPLIGGRAVQGPARPYARAHGRRDDPGPCGECYKGLIDALVIDEADAPRRRRDVALVVTETLMTDREAARRLADVDAGGA